MTQISLDRLEASIAELEAGKDMVSVDQGYLDAMYQNIRMQQELIELLTEAYEALQDITMSGGFRHSSDHQEKRLRDARDALAEYQSHKEGS